MRKLTQNSEQLHSRHSARPHRRILYVVEYGDHCFTTPLVEVPDQDLKRKRLFRPVQVFIGHLFEGLLSAHAVNDAQFPDAYACV